MINLKKKLNSNIIEDFSKILPCEFEEPIINEGNLKGSFCLFEENYDECKMEDVLTKKIKVGQYGTSETLEDIKYKRKQSNKI